MLSWDILIEDKWVSDADKPGEEELAWGIAYVVA